MDRLEPIDLAKAAETIKMLAAKEKPEKVASKVQLKAHLKHYCDIYTEGPICMGEGARIISKAMNMQGIVGDYVFDQKIVNSIYSRLLTGPGSVIWWWAPMMSDQANLESGLLLSSSLRLS